MDRAWSSLTGALGLGLAVAATLAACPVVPERCQAPDDCAPGTACSAEGACQTRCTPGQACPFNEGSPCRLGVSTCEGGEFRCVDAAVAPLGTPCAEGSACSLGACVPAAPLADQVAFLRPVPREILSLARTHLPVTVDFRGHGPQVVDYAIRTSAGTVLQSGTLMLQPGLNPVPLTLSARVTGHRGQEFLLLRVGATEVPFGLGLLFVAAGQSNTVSSECNTCPETLPTHPWVVALVDPYKDRNELGIPSDTAQRLAAGELSFEVLGERVPIANGEFKNVWQPLGARLSRRYSVPVGFITIGKGGTTLAQWLGVLNPRFVYAQPFDITAVLWHQGESDAYERTSRETYKARLRQLIQQVMADLPVPWFVARASVCTGLGPTNMPGAAPMREIEAAQSELLADQGLAFPLFPGPNTNEVPHTCHFDFREEFDAYEEAWYQSLVGSPLLDALTPPIGDGAAPPPTPRDVYQGHDRAQETLLFSRDPAKVGASGREPGGVAFRAADRSSPAFVRPLYLCHDALSGDYRVSGSAFCEDTRYRPLEHLGFAGHASTGPRAKELFRCTFTHDGQPRHLSTLWPEADCASGRMTVQGAQGWVERP